MEQMNEHIRKLKLCVKWFQEVEEGHVQEKEKLRNTLESSERKLTETGNGCNFFTRSCAVLELMM